VPILSKESWHKKTWGDIFANPDFDEIDWSWSCRIKILFEKSISDHQQKPLGGESFWKKIEPPIN
jgi:hypothetical protein